MHLHPARALCCLALLLVLAPGCTNNLLKAAKSVADSINSANPNTGSGDNSSGLTLARVQKDTFDPAGTLDLLGDGSGSMGQLCAPKSTSGSTSTTGNSGPTTCTCAYSYIQTNGTQIGPVEVDTTYHENNLLRCPYSSIPSGVSYVNVYIHLTNSDTQSNSINLPMNGTGVSLDLSNPASFTPVSRFQCRDIVTIPYLWDNSVYDPYLSEDPKYSYPLNFYTTNMGKALALYAGGDSNAGVNAATGWNCPALPNDTSAGMDLTLYSVAADSSGSKAIFPPGGVFDRSTFYVTKSASGVFNQPVNAYIFPGAFTQSQAAGATKPTGIPPVGYGASPIPTSNGGETCPDSSVVIPPGYHWAKLWLFRKQLPQRAYPTSAQLAKLGTISCVPPNWATTPVPSAPNDNYFTDCSGAPNINSLSTAPNNLSARFSEGTAACFRVNPGGTTDPVTKQPTASYSAFPAGSDIWSPVRSDPKYGCGGTSSSDPTHACASPNVPYDASIPTTMGLIDPSTSNPRFDYLFVVSPPSVNRSDMVTTASSTTHSIYTPVRFMSPNDCKSSDPDQPTTAGDCSPSRMLVYQLKLHQVGSPGDPSQDDPSRPGDFPMCVLQPN